MNLSDFIFGFFITLLILLAIFALLFIYFVSFADSRISGAVSSYITDFTSELSNIVIPDPLFLDFSTCVVINSIAIPT